MRVFTGEVLGGQAAIERILRGEFQRSAGLVPSVHGVLVVPDRLGYIVATNEVPMRANSVVRARIDEATKDEATAILKAIGLTVSDAVRMMLVRTVAEKALPFDPLVPNAETLEALREAEEGRLTTVGDLDGLMADLHADD